MRAVLSRLDAGEHAPHCLHCEPRVFVESNCYLDLWIEVLHALGLDPHAMLSPALAVDFEGDQWTFVKPGLDDLRQLYAVDVQELQIWDEWRAHLETQLARGRLVLAEVDAHYLPDTLGTSYHQSHEKTTIALERIDVQARRLGYFHNAGYFTLEGDDFDGVLGGRFLLPPYVELVKLERAIALDPAELRRRARLLSERDRVRRPAKNPITAYVTQFAERSHELTLGDGERFHRYAFANLRQAGSAFELAARFLRWLDPEIFAPPALELEALADACRLSILRLARATQRSRPLDLEPLASQANRWDVAFERLDEISLRTPLEAA